MELLVATSNKHKFAELRCVAAEFGIVLVTPAQVARPELGPLPVVVEDQPTYRGNALKKAELFHQWSGRPTIGDDSGLEVDLLDGRPGVLSARYGGEGATDSERITKLLSEVNQQERIKKIRNRKARFLCSLVCVLGEGQQVEEQGVLEGEVLDGPAGSNGFGYDPIVRIESLGRTLAQCDFETVCRYGFRAQAARKLFQTVVTGLRAKAPKAERV